MAPTGSCEPCRFAVNCWRPLCPFTHLGNGRSKKWAAVWSLLAEQEEVLHSPPAASYAAPAPVIEYAECAVTEMASAPAVECVALAPAVSYPAPAPVIEYAAEPAVTDTAPTPAQENVAPAPTVTSTIRAWLIEHAAAPAISFAPAPVIARAASERAATDTAPAPASEYVTPAPTKKYRAPAPASQRKSLRESEHKPELTGSVPHPGE